MVAIWHNMPREQDGDDMIWRSADEEVLLAPLSDNSNFSIYYNSKLFVPERIYNPITAMGFSVIFSLQLDNTER